MNPLQPNKEILLKYIRAIENEASRLKSLGYSDEKILKKIQLEYKVKAWSGDTSNFKKILRFILSKKITSRDGILYFSQE